MNFLTLCVLYLLTGLACAMAIARRGARRGDGPRERTSRALLAVPLWPLWAPIALSDPVSDEGPVGDGSIPVRIEEALREGVDVADGTALDAMLNAGSSARITEMVRRADARREELRALLSRPEFCLEAARRRVRDAEAEQRPRSLATARLHLDNVERLHAMAAHDEALMHEIADLAEALRTQLLMARFAGSSGDGIGDIIGDLWSRVEALSEAMECGDAGGPQPPQTDAAGHEGSVHGLTPHPGRG
ncbi:MAG: hypothetical protein OXT09_18200 [Myxococcales bacterium]|nr:hypothetical protein [Myxococcales bacterium]